jgi:hypothetical protein
VRRLALTNNTFVGSRRAAPTLTSVLRAETPFGLPAKADAGGSAYPLNADEVVTTLDSFGGGSGGPVFAGDGTLIGILTAGSQDYATSALDCVTIAKGPDHADAANELAVGLHVAMEAICEAAPGDAAIRARCPSPIARRQRPEPGCAMTPSRPGRDGVWWLLASCCFVFATRARWTRRNEPASHDARGSIIATDDGRSPGMRKPRRGRILAPRRQ